MTVGELIKELENYDKDMEVKYTMGGSCNFGEISLVTDEEDGCYVNHNWISRDVVVIGELSW